MLLIHLLISIAISKHHSGYVSKEKTNDVHCRKALAAFLMCVTPLRDQIAYVFLFYLKFQHVCFIIMISYVIIGIQAEVHFLGALHHPNLVKLFGFCAEGFNRLLVYEYMSCGSLEKHLFRRKLFISAKF